jgi:hypothetical protein
MPSIPVDGQAPVSYLGVAIFVGELGISRLAILKQNYNWSFTKISATFSSKKVA